MERIMKDNREKNVIEKNVGAPVIKQNLIYSKHY